MKKQWHKGIAMIELIFALVILGITLMSAPMLVSQATTSSTITFQQESIAMIASHTSALMTYQWDENNTIPEANPNPDILRIPVSGDTDGELDDGNTANVIRGGAVLSFPIARRRQMSIDVPAIPALIPARQASPHIGDDANDFDDIDDFDTTTLETSTASAGASLVTEGEYMDTTIKLNTTIDYANDTTNYGVVGTIDRPSFAVTGNPTNIKTITTTLTSEQIPDKTITLQAFMCNIGGNTRLDEGSF